MKELAYLTVQDMLWINLQITKRVHTFDYARLEEATFYQYGYGTSKNLLSQAGQFVSGFLKLAPLSAGNEATAFVGVLAFLMLNGANVHVSDADAFEWLQRVKSGALSGAVAVEQLVQPTTQTEHHHAEGHAPDVRKTIRQVLESYPDTLDRLMAATAA